MFNLPDDYAEPMDSTPSAVLDVQLARAERTVNYVRLAVLGVLSIAAAAYIPILPLALNLVNLGVLAPMSAWALGQHYLVHARGRASRALALPNAIVDVTAVTAVLAGYGLFGLPDQAVKSPIWVTYFVILAARPFTGSSRRAWIVTCVTVVEYLLLWSFFLGSGRLQLLHDPTQPLHMFGTTLLDEMAKTLLLLVAGGVATYATAWNERTMQRAIEAQQRSEARFRAMFEHTAVGIAMLDGSGSIEESNTAFQAFVGYPVDAVRAAGLPAFAPPEDASELNQMLAQVLADGTSRSAERRFVRKDGLPVWGSLTLSQTAFGGPQRLIAMIQDVSQRKELEAHLQHQALHDPLTGLANRTLFRDRVEHALARARRGDTELSVFFLDVDNFKAVNDTLGHIVGDRLLTTIAERLLNATRGCDTVARLGGDEFAVLLDGAGTDAVRIVAERMVNALRAPIFGTDGRDLHVSASIGIAQQRSGDGADDLLRNADVAMYAAKQRVRGGFVLYDPAMHAQLVDRVALEHDLLDAMAREEFFLVYQPIVGLELGDVRAVEALVRWQHPTRGVVFPDRFIPVAEETGLIVPLGAWVLQSACRQAARWRRQNPQRALGITVNVSGRQIAHGSLTDDVRRALEAAQLSPEALTLEITESVLMEDIDLTMQRLRELKGLGVRLAVDDFGTGYSSLSHLQQFPVDVLKIDRRFIEGVSFDENSTALARTIIALGGMLALRTVAEGVENETQRERLTELGCGLAQGFLFSRPVTSAEVDRLLQAPLPDEVAAMFEVDGGRSSSG